MKDWMTPKGRKRERARQASLSEGRKRYKRAQATATNKVKCHPPNLAPPPFGRSRYWLVLWLWLKRLGL